MRPELPARPPARPLPTAACCSHTPLSDGCWAVLEVLPLLSLDLSRSKVRGATAGHRLSALTSLQLLDSQVDDGGCRSLAAALPAVKRLQLGGRHVGDKGLRALCSSLPQVRRLSFG